MKYSPKIDRRTFMKGSLLSAATLPFSAKLSGDSAKANEADSPSGEDPPAVVDTNVHLFEWPFRRLKYSRTGDLVEKLRTHRITEAWAGSFEALFHKNLYEVNARLAEECRSNGEGMLIPFGSVNPVWPDWEEELRRCHETHQMPGIRLYPSYQNYTLDRPEFVRLLERATERGLLVQIAVRMEDPRVHHPRINAPPTETAPLVDAVKKVPEARVQLLNSDYPLRGGDGETLVAETDVACDISRIEGSGGVGRLIEGDHWYIRAQVPEERLLFGSHAPYFPIENALLKLFESPLTLGQLKTIMNANARRLLADK